jgi:hypothetical protein
MKKLLGSLFLTICLTVAPLAADNGKGNNGNGNGNGGSNNDGGSGGSAPEINPASAASALALVGFSVIAIRGRRKK